MRAPWLVRLINAGILYFAFSAYYWLVGTEISRFEAMGMMLLGAFVGQFSPLLPPNLFKKR